MKVFVVTLMLVACAFAAPGVIDNQIESDSTVSKMMKYFGSCVDSQDLTTCLAVKGITAVNRAARASNIEIASGVTLTREANANARAGKAISENEIVSSLPADQEERSGRLYDLALESIGNFFESHSIQLKVPTDAGSEIARAIEDGRKLGKGKLKKLIKPLIFGLGAKMFAIVPLLLVGLGFLAFKALIVSKIALLLAVILSASKLMGGGAGGLFGKVAGGGGAGGLLSSLAGLSGGLGGGSSSGSSSGYASGQNSGWSSGSGASSNYPYARSYNEEEANAQDLAYNAQVPSS